MPTLEFETVVASPIERVWAWHEDIAAALPALSPPGDDVRLVRVEPLPPRVGTEVEISAQGPLGKWGGRLTWHARYTEHVPPHAVLMSMEARFVDEAVKSPFAYWRHSHEFEALDDKTTRCLDRVEYRPPLWPLSLPADLLLIRPKLHAMFRHRHATLRTLFGG